MIALRDWTIKAKLTAILMLTSALAVLLACSAIIVFDYFEHRRALVEDLSGLADVTGRNCEAALAFRIPEDATLMLSALAAKPAILIACVYDANGDVFSTYRRQGAESIAPPELGKRGYVFEGGYLRLFHDVELDNKVIGSVYLQADLRGIYASLLRDGAVVALAALIAFGAAFTLSAKLQAFISRPILALADLARAVSGENDYSIRAVKEGNDEVGLLIDAFNEMLAEIQQRDEAFLSEKQLSEDYINSLPGLFYVFDEQRFVRWNREWERVTGYSDEELDVRYGTDFFEGKDKALIEERMRKVFREGAADAEAEMVTKDGRRIPYYFTGLRCDFNGKAHLVGLGIDISERKRAEEERRELEAQLRQAQKLEAVGQLAGGVAHDFNNILTAILGNVELSIGSARRELGAEHQVTGAMEEIEKASLRASALTRQLLTFSRRSIMQPEVLNLNRILAELDNMLQRLITEDIAFETVTDPELQSVRADAGQLEQVIVNLVVNAAHAMPDGGRLTLETQNVTLDEYYASNHAEAQPGPCVLLAVSDTGHGMDAATRERIFEPFFTTKPVDKGTGLGLATVHGIVKQSGGHIMVYSEPGRGTTFKIYLPAVEATGAARAPTSQPDEFPHGHESVLLCEDDLPVRELIALSLRTAGYSVTTAGSGQEGLEAAQAHTGPFDLLITDVIMPDMNGRALSERLCATYPGLPTLFISGYSSNVIAHHGVLDEGVEFLEKPFTRQRLLTKVRAVLEKARSDA